MKTVLILLFLLAMSGTTIAQNNEYYRSRNYKLNRNYLKQINTQSHQVALYKSKKINPDESQLKKSHQSVTSPKSKKLVMKFDQRKMQQKVKTDYRNQKSTYRDPDKKKSKKIFNYVTMVLAFSLFLVY